jgi:hypothetical protein
VSWFETAPSAGKGIGMHDLGILLGCWLVVSFVISLFFTTYADRSNEFQRRHPGLSNIFFLGSFLAIPVTFGLGFRWVLELMGATEPASQIFGIALGAGFGGYIMFFLSEVSLLRVDHRLLTKRVLRLESELRTYEEKYGRIGVKEEASTNDDF